MKVIKELAVAVASYEDRATGQTKNRYKNIGVVMESTNDRGETNTFMMLDRSFNPAGVPFKPGSDKILVSMFEPRQDGGKPDEGQRQERSQPQGGSGYGWGGRPDLDGDLIPF